MRPVAPALVQLADVFPTVRQRRNVGQHEYRAAHPAEALAGGTKVAGHNLRFGDAVVGEEAVGRLCVRPILTGPGQVSTVPSGKLSEQFAETFARRSSAKAPHSSSR